MWNERIRYRWLGQYHIITKHNRCQQYPRFQTAQKGSWKDVVELPDPPSKLEEAIRCGGLAQLKSKRIHSILKTLVEERGSPSLEYLRDLSNAQIKQELGRFPGCGPKTISCVLLFTLLRPEFPVDTHVHRITKDVLKWTDRRATREDGYDQLNAAIPDEFKLELHCLLVAHGRQCHRCAARGKPQFPPKDGTKLPCPLVRAGLQVCKIDSSAAVKPEI
jgi:endonuclease III